MATWKESGAIVFPMGAAPVVWTDLSGLPAEVGAQKVWAFLHIKAFTGGNEIAFRPKADPDDWFSASVPDGKGLCNVFAVSTVGDSGVFVPTDANGLVEWISTGASSMQVTLIGYVDEITDYAGAAFYTGALPAGWNDRDLSAIVGPNISAAFIKDEATNAWAATEDHLTRKHGDVDDWANTQTNTAAAANKINDADINDVYAILGLTNAAGLLSMWSTLGTGTSNLFVDSFVDEDGGYQLPVPGQEIIYPSAAAPAAWTALNISAAIGEPKRVLAFIKVKQTGGSTSSWSLAFRENGTSYAFQSGTYSPGACSFRNPRSALVIVPTDENGVIEWQTSAGSSKFTELELLGFIGPQPPPTGLQTTLNTVDVTFNEEPNKLDPSAVNDALNLDNYTVTGPASPSRLLQVVTYEGGSTVRLWFDGPLVEGEQYAIAIANVEAVDGTLIAPPGSEVAFTAFGVDDPSVPLRLERSDAYDLANPQVSQDARGGTLGTFRVDETGDLDVETRRAALRKRVLRRCTTAPGGFIHLDDYGLYPGSKVLTRPSAMRKLQQDAESQIAREPEVVSVRATVSQLLPGVVRLSLAVVDQYGPLTIETVLGGDDA